jgi:diguanylate cyclase (GGDEF)-like protein/hemerythrin-like metal-binding protein
MDMSGDQFPWLADATLRDLIRQFPLPIALLDDVGGVVLMNDLFERGYGSEVLDAAPLKGVIRDPAPGWKSIELPLPRRGKARIKAQVVRARGVSMLIFDDVTDKALLHRLDQLRGQVAELERLSSTDPLTSAWNRTHLDQVIAAELDRSMRFRQPVSLILLDIDHFKRVNDSYGHQAGDSVLRELVQVIRASVRSVDMLYRWGGEEFALLAASTGYRSGAVVAEKIRSQVELHRFAGVGSVTISLGVAEHIATESAEVWFRRVDQALYRAKSEGRNPAWVDLRGSSDSWAAESGPSVIRLLWQEAYECGEPTIDREHRELFELANSLLDASFKTASSPEAFGVAIERLLAHLARHFADEEALLAQRGYEGLESHRRAHAALLARAEQLKARVAAGKTTLGDLVDFLANTVIAQHLFRADRQYFPLFRQPTEPERLLE